MIDVWRDGWLVNDGGGARYPLCGYLLSTSKKYLGDIKTSAIISAYERDLKTRETELKTDHHSQIVHSYHLQLIAFKGTALMYTLIGKVTMKTILGFSFLLAIEVPQNDHHNDEAAELFRSLRGDLILEAAPQSLVTLHLTRLLE